MRDAEVRRSMIIPQGEEKTKKKDQSLSPQLTDLVEKMKQVLGTAFSCTSKGWRQSRH